MFATAGEPARARAYGARSMDRGTQSARKPQEKGARACATQQQIHPRRLSGRGATSGSCLRSCEPRSTSLRSPRRSAGSRARFGGRSRSSSASSLTRLCRNDPVTPCGSWRRSSGIWSTPTGQPTAFWNQSTSSGPWPQRLVDNCLPPTTGPVARRATPPAVAPGR